jgi:hypothetical protein
MGFDLQAISPEARAIYIKDGGRFGSEDTLDQANQTFNAYTLHGAKLNAYGFTSSDAHELQEADRGRILWNGGARKLFVRWVDDGVKTSEGETP